MLGVEVLNQDETMLYPLALTFGNTAKARKEIALGDTMELAVTAFVETGKSWKNVAAFEAEKEADDFIGIGWFFPFGPYSALDSQRTSSPRAGFLWCGECNRTTNKFGHWDPVPHGRVAMRLASVFFGDCGRYLIGTRRGECGIC